MHEVRSIRLRARGRVPHCLLTGTLFEPTDEVVSARWNGLQAAGITTGFQGKKWWLVKGK